MLQGVKKIIAGYAFPIGGFLLAWILASAGGLTDGNFNQADEQGATIALLANAPTFTQVNQNVPVTYYAQLMEFSTSGTMKFYFYDIQTKQIISRGRYGTWFWGTLVGESPEQRDQYIQSIGEQSPGVIFMIKGVRHEDDREFYLDGRPVQDIEIESIEIAH